jgi:hypothetical protein
MVGCISLATILFMVDGAEPVRSDNSVMVSLLLIIIIAVVAWFAYKQGYMAGEKDEMKRRGGAEQTLPNDNAVSSTNY